MAQITNLSFGQNCRRNGLSIPALVDVEAKLMAAIRGLYFRKRSSSVTSDWTQAERGVSIHVSSLMKGLKAAKSTPILDF